jgi:hypothetical protein
VASPQKEEGHIDIANELYDVLSMIRLTQYQRDALRLVIRMTYGCRQTSCRLLAWTDFEYCAGIHRTKVKRVLESLAEAKIFVIDWDERVIHLNKDYEKWEVEFSPTFRADRYAELLVHNIKTKFEIRGISQKLIVLANSYKLIANSVLAISYNHISQWLIASGVKRLTTGAEVPDRSNRSKTTTGSRARPGAGTRARTREGRTIDPEILRVEEREAYRRECDDMLHKINAACRDDIAMIGDDEDMHIIEALMSYSWEDQVEPAIQLIQATTLEVPEQLKAVYEKVTGKEYEHEDI